MKAIYMSEFHPKLLYATYSVDRCAVSFATASLWYLQRGDIDKAIDQCDYVIEEILPVYNKKDDMIGLYHILIALIRVLKWNGEVDKAREVYNNNTPEGIEKHFAVGHVHEPMLLLLRICDGSSEEYSTVESSDIELALEFTPSDMTDNNMTCDGWSIMSLSAEICLHLARRLPPGNAERERLVERGIHHSTIANKRVTASNGMIKHLLAYDAHKEIHKKLLILASEDVGITRTIIYDDSSMTKMTNGSISTCSGTKKSSLKSSVTGAVSLASRFVVKGDTSKGSNGSSSGAPSSKVFSAPSHVDTARKKVAFSHLSSFESHGSRHSENSQSSAHETALMPPSQPKQPINIEKHT